MADHEEGAKPSELVLEACRRNNTELLHEVLSTMQRMYSSTSADRIAELLNTSTDALGRTALHVAAGSGSYEVLDIILDQEGVETDPIDRMEGDTPLHSAVRWVNALNTADWAAGEGVVEILVDAGCDARLRNKAKLRPVDLADPRNKPLRETLQKAIFMSGVVDADVVNEDEEDGDHGPPSDEEI